MNPLHASHPLFFKPRILQNSLLLLLIKTANEARAVLHTVFQPQQPIQVHRVGQKGGWRVDMREACLAVSKESSLETQKALGSITVAPEAPKLGGGAGKGGVVMGAVVLTAHTSSVQRRGSREPRVCTRVVACLSVRPRSVCWDISRSVFWPRVRLPSPVSREPGMAPGAVCMHTPAHT